MMNRTLSRRLLILTQAVDRTDPVLAFTHRWVEEFAKRCEHVHVICLKEGDHDLPPNVFVHSLGKEEGASRMTYIVRFFEFVWKYRDEYDAVFVHMNPEYVLMGSPLWRMWGKRVVLWYAHRQRSWKLYAALLLAHRVVTAAKESLTVRSSKIDVIGHGIDTGVFSSHTPKTIDRNEPRIVAVGRITPIKNLDVAIEAIAQLRQGGKAPTLDLIGGPISESDRRYEEELRDLIKDLGVQSLVSFVGSIPNHAMPHTYPRYDLALNLCPTGGIDKAVLESMASAVPTVVSNEAFKVYFGSYSDSLLARYRDPDNVSKKIRALLERGDLSRIQTYLRETAKAKADVTSVISAIMERLYAKAPST